MLKMKGYKIFLLGTSLLVNALLEAFPVERIQRRKNDAWVPIGTEDSKDDGKIVANPAFAARKSEIVETDEDYKDLIKHLQNYEDDNTSSDNLVASSFPSREIINIFPKVVEINSRDPDQPIFSGIETILTDTLRPLIKLISNLFSKLSLDSVSSNRQVLF